MHPLSPRPFLLLVVVASVLQRASASFSCSDDEYLQSDDYSVCTDAANRLDSAVEQSQSQSVDFRCCCDFGDPLHSSNCERDTSLLEATVNASGNNVDFYCDGGFVRLHDCPANLQCLNAIATSGTNYPTPSGSTSAPTSSTPSSTPTTTAPSGSPASSAPTAPPTTVPSPSPSAAPTTAPTTSSPTGSPSSLPTSNPTSSVPTAPPTANPTHLPTTSRPTGSPSLHPTSGPVMSLPTATPTVSPTAFPTATPTAGPTPSPTTIQATETTSPATTLQSDPDEQQSTEVDGDGIQTYVIIALSLVLVNCGVCGVCMIWRERTKRIPSEPDHDRSSFEQSSVIMRNPAYRAAPPTVEYEPVGPAQHGDIGDAYEVGQTLNPNYEPTLPERMGNRLYAEIQPTEEPHGGSYATLRGDQQVYDQFYERPPDRHTDSSA